MKLTSGKDMKLTSSMLALVPAFALTAQPVVETGSVTIAQDPDTRQVTIGYTLSGEPGVVTLDIRTNGVSIGGCHYSNAAGDVNRLIQPGDHTILWRPDKSWEGTVITDESVTAEVTAWATNTPPDYMALDLSAPYGRWYYASADAVPKGVGDRMYKSSKMLFRKIPAANVEWRIGSGTNYTYTIGTENSTPHYVILTRDYYMAIYETTQAQFEEMFPTETNPSKFKNYEESPYMPVETIRADNVCTNGNSLLNGFASLIGDPSFGLPTEAQWEFAARAGKGTQLPNGKNLSVPCDKWNPVDPNLAGIAWVNGNSKGGDGVNRAHEVGLKEPNDFGLYDVIGNVWEFCRDSWTVFPVNPSPDPDVDPVMPYYKNIVKKGGAYSDASQNRYRNTLGYRAEQAASGGSAQPYNGMRLCCDAIVIK